MKLYTIKNCDYCDKIKNWIKEEKIDVEISELKKIEGKYYESINNNYVEFNENINAYPALKIDNTFIVGYESAQQYLKKGYLHDVKKCPYNNYKDCIEDKCEKFVIIKRGSIYEGGCADFINSLLLIQSLKSYNKEVDNAKRS